MYFGSVRFFKNLILLCVILLIAIPVVLAVRFALALSDSRQSVEQLTTRTEEMTLQIDQLQGQIAELEQVVSETALPNYETFSAERPSYQSLYPDFYAPQPLSAQERTEGVIYLTFDDGPTKNTDAVLRILAENDVKATFFVTGHTDEAAKQRMRNILEQGHTLGMHSFTHEYGTIYNSVEDYLDDMYQLFTLIRDATGYTPTVFRFPGGSINGYNYAISQELIAEMLRRGFVPYDWNLSAQDATSSPIATEAVIRNVVSDVPGKVRGFVLMHDGASQYTTVQALDDIIDRLREMGYQFDCLHPDTMPVLFKYEY